MTLGTLATLPRATQREIIETIRQRVIAAARGEK